MHQPPLVPHASASDMTKAPPVMLARLVQLTAKLDRGLKHASLAIPGNGDGRGRKLDTVMNIRQLAQHQGGGAEYRFGLLTGLISGGLIHIGSNAAVKRMLKPGPGASRIGSALFQRGVRDAGKGRVIHPMIQRASDALLGPEWIHVYDAGV